MRSLLRSWFRWICEWIGTVPDPSAIQVKVKGEVKMALVFSVLLPEGDDMTDVAFGMLTVNRVLAGEAQESTHRVEIGQSAVDGLVGDQDTVVDLSFVWVDDAGNSSANPATGSFELSDNIPPADPGSLSVLVTGEE